MGPLKSLSILILAVLSLTLYVESRGYRFLPEKEDDTEELGVDYLQLRDDTQDLGTDYNNLDDDAEDFGEDYNDLRDDTQDLGAGYNNLDDNIEDLGADYYNLEDDTEELGVDYLQLRDDTQDLGTDYNNLDDGTENFGEDYNDLRDDTQDLGAGDNKLDDYTEDLGADYYNLGDDTEKVGADYINLPTCGKSSAAGSRVIGGTDATPGEWPWQAKLRTKDSGFTCGGSLITPTWVMTAAHCVSSSDDPSVYSVTMGDLNREISEGTEQEFNVKRVVVHPEYNSPIAINNDIALLQLTRSANKTSFVNTVCLPDESEVVPVGTKCYISGWGQMTHPDDAAIKLQQAPMPVVSNRVCQAKHWKSPISSAGETGVTSAMLCAGDAGKTKISGCFGDSGGPFVCRNTAGQWVQQGIVSWGDTVCSSKSHFTVFARVSVFRQWIEDTISE